MEDIASTFEDIMARAYEPKGCYEVGEPLYNKASIINSVLIKSFNTVYDNTSYQWNRFI